MKKPTPDKYNEAKYLRAYLIVMMERISWLEAKIDMIQYDICKDGPAAGLSFLDSKRKRLEASLKKKYSDDTSAELAGLIGMIEDRDKQLN